MPGSSAPFPNSYPPTPTNWRLLLDSAAPGAWNMAVDEALLLCHTPTAPPIVRFYDWQPACLSLGRLQRLDAALQSSILNPQSSIQVVRRPTGGRAVLHQCEVTCSVVIHEMQLPSASRSVLGSYRWLSHGWVAGLRQLAINAELAPSSVGLRSANANCFSSMAQCDFLVEHKKLIGAAQCRRRGVILQHGSLLIDADAAAWETWLGGSMRDTVTLRALGVTATRPEIISALSAGLAQTAQMIPRRDVLTDREAAMAHRLHYEKYTQPTWTEQGWQQQSQTDIKL